MNTVQKAIIPGIILTSLLLFFLNSQMNPPLSAVAATEAWNADSRDSQDQHNENGSCDLYDKYPQSIQPWCNLIESTAKQHGLDPLLIAAVMLVESGGQPEVISHSGAVGLLQVMPRDGVAASFQCINGPCFANRPSTAELKDPGFNIEYGTGMLSGLLERTGILRDALKSYGPYDVEYQYADKVLSIYDSIR